MCNNTVNILTLISSALIAIFTGIAVYYHWKQVKESKPQIAHIKSFDEGLEIIIVNNKSPRVTIRKDSISYKKKNKRFFGKSQRPTWNFPDKLVKLHATMGHIPVAYIEDQAKIHLTIPNFDHKATYKVVVKTSGGKCSCVHTNTQD